MPYRLGVDLGTTFTAAAVADGSTEPTVIGLGNRALQIPSVVFLKPDGDFLVGEAAERRGLTEPDRLAREFKRRIGDHVPIMVAGAPFSPQALTAHLLRWVVDRASERMGEPPAEVILTHPANWGPFRMELLDQVAVMAGVGAVLRCTEPEAAAAQYAAQTRVAPGDKVAVYDLGGGTFDACVLEKTDTGFRTLGTAEGVEHLGGVDFDEAVLRHVLGALGPAANLDPDDPAVTIGLARLRRDCVEAKEALSTDVDTLVPVALPGLSTTVRITRAEFELMIRPALTETVAAMRRALKSAQLEPTQLRSILLVGGSSRIPLVSEMLHREFSVPTALDTHPKHDVALGSVRVGQEETDPLAAAPGQAAPPPAARSAEPVEGPTASVAAPDDAAAAGEPPDADETPPTRQPTAAVLETPDPLVPPAPPPTPARAVRPSANAPGGVAQGPSSAGNPPPVEPSGAAAVVAPGGAAGPPAGAGTPPPPPPNAAAAMAGPGDDGAATPPPTTEPTAEEAARPTGGLLRVLAVVVAAVLLGVGVGVAIALRNRDEPPSDPPATSAPPTETSTPEETPSPSPTQAALPQSADPLGDEVLVWPRVRNGNWDIALLDLQSGEETPLTTSPLEDSFPVLTHDRRTVIYNQVTENGIVLRVMGADGRGDRELLGSLPEGCEGVDRPATTPDGLVVMTCVTSQEPTRRMLTVMAPDGTLVRKLTEPGNMGDPAVTPDGQSVVLWINDEGDADGGSLYRVALDGSSKPAKLTDGGDGGDADPVVSPDGTQVAFRRIADGDRFIVVAPFDGNSLTDTPKIRSGNENDQDPSWSPDGQRLAYKQGPNRNGDLRVVDLESGASSVVVDNADPDTAPAWTAR